MTRATRDVAGMGRLGNRRYSRYLAAFDRVVHCVDAGYYLEAIAILDSLIWDRLASRLGYLTGKNSDLPSSSGRLCIELVGGAQKNAGFEKDPAFRDAVRAIQDWVKKRNEALHATAKVFRSEDSPKDFAAILQSHRQDALDGIKYLQIFDGLDTASRAKAGKRTATNPNAFFPERRGNRVPLVPAECGERQRFPVPVTTRAE